ncbi:Uncharacterised protein [Serratia ficaria]|uniref:DUF3037 domain-containing protein n=1 Tax=Serratia ficaria TaxID=61651 RepID=UPI002179F64E|nr:DUF3037 domain-containing protein [Serratia ficaria]CAI1604640.1 Uncharacterised protein [Serratia ficaria]
MTDYKYSIIRITPNPVRAESINVGFVVMTPTGPDIRILESAGKIKAITSSYSLDNLSDFAMKLESILVNALSLEDAVGFFQGSICLSVPGTFRAGDEKDYNAQLNEINRLYITPEKSSTKSTISQKRILTELKDEFSKAGILGRNLHDIYDHKVVHKYPLAEEEGLYAELLLKNGAYHLTETLDLRTDNIKQKMGDSALKAITMNTARSVLDGEVKTFLVYAAETSSQQRKYSHQLNLVQNHTDKIFNLLSKEDMTKYFDHMFSAAGSSLRYDA